MSVPSLRFCSTSFLTEVDPILLNPEENLDMDPQIPVLDQTFQFGFGSLPDLYTSKKIYIKEALFFTINRASMNGKMVS